MRFTLINKKELLKTRPFTVEQLDLGDSSGKALEHPWFRLKCPDWVNVLPITSDRRAILIRQSRIGSFSEILETPGGEVDPTEKDVAMAALRELEEETGFTSQRILPLGSINPNPAIMTNKCHFFVALGCHINPERKHFPDLHEEIRVEIKPIEELEELVRYGRVDHALSALCIMLARKYLS